MFELGSRVRVVDYFQFTGATGRVVSNDTEFFKVELDKPVDGFFDLLFLAKEIAHISLLDERDEYLLDLPHTD